MFLIDFIKFKQFANLFFIALAAIIGSLIRFQVNNYFFVNIVGAGILGFVSALPVSRRVKLIISSSFCGSLTTFSAWILDFSTLLLNGLFIKAFVVVAYTLMFGLLAGVCGYLMGNLLSRLRPFL